MDNNTVLHQAVTNSLIVLADEFITQWDKHHPGDPIQLLDRTWFNHREGEIYEHIHATPERLATINRFTNEAGAAISDEGPLSTNLAEAILTKVQEEESK